MNITAVLCQSQDRRPLVDIAGLPCADLTPEQLRALADTLRRIADDCEAQPMGKKHYRAQRREYVMTPDPAKKAV